MSEILTPEQYRTEISMLNHEVYELTKQLEERETEEVKGSIIDKYNPFDNPTEYPDYSGDYTEIVPQIAIPGCRIPVEPNRGEKKRLRRFYTIGGTSLLCHFLATNILATALVALVMFILQFKNPDASYSDLYSFASSSAIMISISTIVYLLSNVGFTLMGLKWAKIRTSELIKTRDFSVGKAIQYCFSAIFIQYAAALFSVAFSDIIDKYGFSTDVIDDSNFAKTTAGFILMIIYTCIIAPITEELLFRGMLLKTFSRANQRFAIVASSIFFGLAHGNLTQFMLAFLLGMFLSHITLKHNSILPSIIVHIFVNTTATVISELYDESGSMVLNGVLNMIYLLMAVVGLIMFIEFALKNKLPATTPQQSRRGFTIAKTSIPTILVFFLQAGYTILLILMTKLT